MSWQAYVDTNLLGTGKISKAAILGQQGGIWAASKGYTLSTEEQKAIVTSFTNPAKVHEGGIRLAGNKFFGLRVEEGRSVYLKKGGDGACLVKTKQAVLVAEYVAPVQAGEATPVVEGLADYLIGVGY